MIALPPLVADRAIADQRDRPTWLKARSRSIGGSDAANFAKLTSAPRYLASKLHDPFDGNRYTIHGNDREKHMLAAYGFEQNTMLFHAPTGERHSHRHVATPDGFRLRRDGRLVLAQCKTTNHPFKTIPPKYLRQCWWEQYVLGVERTLFIWELHVDFRPVSFEPESIWIDRDDSKIRDLIQIATIVLDGMDAASEFTRERNAT